MFRSKFVGGILLIVGTSIGGGMLALPMVNASVGFWPSAILLLFAWAAMTVGALFILEATLYVPRGQHMVSMAATTIGVPGLIVAWSSYLLLLYALLSAYIAGGADLLQEMLSLSGCVIGSRTAACLFTVLLGSIVLMGMKQVDIVNRLLMFAKLTGFVILIAVLLPAISVHQWHVPHPKSLMSMPLMVLITSFGFAIIVPNLRDYFNDDIRQLRKVIWVGSLIPLVCYLLWDAVIMGVLPAEGPEGLQAIAQSAHATSSLAIMLSRVVHNPFISGLFSFFTAICMLTAFLGVALCLLSFLADGFKLKTSGREGLGLAILTFGPPLFIVMFYPSAYLYALNGAGYICVILLLALPAWMVLSARQKKLPMQTKTGYQIPYHRALAITVLVVSAVLCVQQMAVSVGN